ncbi:endonuclease VII domain-containing protein [Defluviimonas sp. WL0050]|uniref:Endonuclease VII domain-containing protein n=1 Tax=Albidovulum litorale TaxID=2984134 RepID=A0ABT2ZQJ1_9RHOB|nr:endonuclease VII domain-containing protein [Defluviimonas sp. WL0050]MCV2873235.1 endonuclease VII domain-containing protein [Defluviimonas sp. WL0050]
MKEITLTQEQIEQGRAAAMKRDGKYRPTPPEAVALARQLFEERRKFTEREAKEVAALIGWSHVTIWQRYLMGELGLPTPNIERALAFTAGQHTYTRTDGTVRRVNDGRNFHHDRANWIGQAAMGAAFPGFSADDYGRLWDESGGRCPCCGVEMDGAEKARNATVDHLVPGVRSIANARLLCSACNVIKANALPETLHRVADWMQKTPTEMLAVARTLPAMPRRRVDGQDRWKAMLWHKKAGANECGIDFNLALHDLPFTAVCPVLGVPFLLPGSEESLSACRASGVKRGRNFWNSPSFDRIDPRQGYVAGNVVLVSNLANKIMSNGTSPDRVRLVADWFERELATAPDLAALIDYDAHEHWKIAAE